MTVNFNKLKLPKLSAEPLRKAYRRTKKEVWAHREAIISTCFISLVTGLIIGGIDDQEDIRVTFYSTPLLGGKMNDVVESYPEHDRILQRIFEDIVLSYTDGPAKKRLIGKQDSVEAVGVSISNHVFLEIEDWNQSHINFKVHESINRAFVALDNKTQKEVATAFRAAVSKHFTDLAHKDACGSLQDDQQIMRLILKCD